MNAKILHLQIVDRPRWDIVSFIGLDTSNLTTSFVGKQSEIQALLHALVRSSESIDGFSSVGEFVGKLHREIDGNVFLLKRVFEFGIDPSDLHLLLDSLTEEQVESLRLYGLDLGHRSSSFWEWQSKTIGEVVAEDLATSWLIRSIKTGDSR